jgi:predicted O-methyltransferase YrrM
MPLDYQPSRNFEARWSTSNPIPQLAEWFARDVLRYRELINAIRQRAPEMAIGVDYEFSAERLPRPAWTGTAYGMLDALFIMYFVQTLKPRTFLEIGSGISTAFAHHAASSVSHDMKIVSIDPEPRAAIDAICDEVIRAPLEGCDISVFEALEPNDIVFLDGSHRSFMNSDVTVFFIEVLPKLKPGVIIHIHDISLPYDYPPWAKNWYWNEQYMLAVYLMGHMNRINVLAPTSYISQDPAFEDLMTAPFVDFGSRNTAGQWRGGGAFWFTHLLAQ